MSRLYTRTGDTGETGLFGGERVPKDHLRIEAVGAVDELNSALGVALSHLEELDLRELLRKAQNQLFNVGADLSTPGTDDETRGAVTVHRIGTEEAAALEPHIDRLEGEVPPLSEFILPGGARPAAHLHLARAICRRAERRVVTLSHHEEVNPAIIAYLNRLSDLLFAVARAANMRSHVLDTFWEKHALA
jgi:cob(I)alamin adenosyltransferase